MNYVFQQPNGTPYPHNDEDSSPMLLESRVHAKRVIAWLGLTDVKIVKASDGQLACGHLVMVHSREYRKRLR